MSTISAPLGFLKPEGVTADTERAGLLRAAKIVDTENPAELDFHTCELHDWSASGASSLNLETMGFDAIQLGHLPDVQNVLARVRAAGEITPDDAKALRRGLTGQIFKLSAGSAVRMLNIAPEGLIMRKSGPNGLQTEPDVEISEMNGHGAANAVHGDQDVRGTPLKQIMRGAAPWIFRHQTPDGSNHWAPLRLINVWIPLDQVTRPLTLMDRRTLNNRKHQLRYALPTETFLDREEETAVNDIWTFLYDAEQRWHFNSDMRADQAYVFDTLGTPHGATTLPGEARAEQCYLECRDLIEQLSAGQFAQAAESAQALGNVAVPESTDALRAAIEKMQSLAADVAAGQIADASAASAWIEKAHIAMDRVVRKSVEMRVVALHIPNIWPLNRLGDQGQ